MAKMPAFVASGSIGRASMSEANRGRSGRFAWLVLTISRRRAGTTELKTARKTRDN
jgi:hypothetical protein